MSGVSDSKEKKRRNQAGDDDELPMRPMVREYIDGNFVIILMAFTTLYVLVADDFRLWFTLKPSDFYFFIANCISLGLFLAELLVKSCVEDEFKYSFFFWLDFVATVSLVFDLPPLLDLFGAMLLLDPSNTNMDVKFGKPITNSGDNPLSTILTSFRLIRLIRIIKLYNYVSKSNAASEEAKLRE